MSEYRSTFPHSPGGSYSTWTTSTEFLCDHRDRSGSLALREQLLGQHWSYMDRYDKEMIARGPTLAGDGDTPTGSLHVVDLPDPADAGAFAFDEPGYQAGVYRDVLLRRWRNLLGRTMWEFPGGRTGGDRYLVLGCRWTCVRRMPLSTTEMARLRMLIMAEACVPSGGRAMQNHWQQHRQRRRWITGAAAAASGSRAGVARNVGPVARAARFPRRHHPG
ncbi:YciI family protein [Amycolatopsis sp. cg5]|uniref:YciI family protein n=1 Tax=Amycolatopsis sp. cg5 TaxID=3238802 RepID=UPI003524C79B